MNDQSKYSINEPNVTCEEIDGEVIIVNLLNGKYYSTQNMGAYIWGRISHGESFGEMRTDLCERFAKHTKDIDSELPAFIEKLAEEELIVSVNGNTSGNVTLINAQTPSQYVSPNLECYSDMQDLLLLDPIHDVDENKGWPTAQPDTAD